MAGAMRKMAVYLGLVEDDRYDEYDDYVDYDEEAGAERGVAPEQGSFQTSGRGASGRARAAHVSRDASDSGAGESTTADIGRITTLCPRTYNEARTVGEHFRQGTPVIINLTEMVDGDAKRLVDFAAGLIFGLHGDIDRVASKVFLLVPPGVEVTAETKARIAEGGFFNQS